MKKVFELRREGEYMNIDYVSVKLNELSDLVSDYDGFDFNYDIDNNGSFETCLTNMASNKELCWKFKDGVLTYLIDEVMQEKIRSNSEEEIMDIIEKGIHNEMGVSEKIITFTEFNKIDESADNHNIYYSNDGSHHDDLDRETKRIQNSGNKKHTIESLLSKKDAIDVKNMIDSFKNDIRKISKGNYNEIINLISKIIEVKETFGGKMLPDPD